MATVMQLIERIRVQAGDGGCEQCFEQLCQLVERPATWSVALSAAAAHGLLFIDWQTVVRCS
jgi:hypothetical protein